MEEAGLAVAQEAWMLLGTLEGRRIVVLAGPGNNGGDGSSPRATSPTGARTSLVYVAGQTARRDVSVPSWRSAASRSVRGEDDPDAAGLASCCSGARPRDRRAAGDRQDRAARAQTSRSARALLMLAEARRGYSPPKLVAVDLPTGDQRGLRRGGPAHRRPRHHGHVRAARRSGCTSRPRAACSGASRSSTSASRRRPRMRCSSSC